MSGWVLIPAKKDLLNFFRVPGLVLEAFHLRDLEQQPV